MGESLQRVFSRLEDQRAALFARLDGLGDDRLNRRPAEDQWSVIQVLRHLTTAEEASLADVRRQLEDPSKLAEAGLRSTVMSASLTAALRSGLRFKAPARAVPDTGEQTLEEARRRWDGVRAGWRETIESFPPELAGKAIFRHPRVGLLSLAQALRFMGEHVRHHDGQVDRILAAVA